MASLEDTFNEYVCHLRSVKLNILIRIKYGFLNDFLVYVRTWRELIRQDGENLP